MTIGGYAGMSLILHAPEDVVETDCERGEIITYVTSADDFWRNTQRLDEISELWILDVDDTVVIIDLVSSPGNPTEMVEQARSVVESARFE